MAGPSLRIYLAGFDVFRPDAAAHGQRLKGLCARHGFEGLYPLDNALPASLTGGAAARWIFEANLALIRQADLVLANLNRFRGAEPDSGTAFEVGFAAALGKPVWAYTDDGRPLLEQVAHHQNDHGVAVCADGLTVEDFGLPLNLMLACSVKLVIGDAATALAHIQSAHPAGQPPAAL